MSDSLYRAFHALVATLERDRIPIDPRDYGRIRLVFSSRHEWDLPSIRRALGALLAHEPDQRQAFDRCFDQLITPVLVQGSLPASDLTGVLRELREYQPATPVLRPPAPRPLTEGPPAPLLPQITIDGT